MLDATLRWISTAERLPDDELTVLIWVREDDGTCDWYAGWLDGTEWRDCTTAGVVAGDVTHWADVQGPKQGRA